MSKKYIVGSMYAGLILFIQDSDDPDKLLPVSQFLPNRHKLKSVQTDSLQCTAHDADNEEYYFSRLNVAEGNNKYKLLKQSPYKKSYHPYNVFVSCSDDKNIIIDLEDYFEKLDDNIEVIKKWGEDDVQPFVNHKQELTEAIVAEVQKKTGLVIVKK